MTVATTTGSDRLVHIETYPVRGSLSMAQQSAGTVRIERS